MANDPVPLRGDVWLTAFGPSIGGEIQKSRPAVIVSTDFANHLLNRVQVVPISSRIGRLYRAEAAIVLNGEQRKALGDQITTTSKQRLLRRVGRLSEEDLAAVGRALQVQLGL